MRFTVVVLALFFSLSVLAQDVPQAIKDGFVKQFPTATEADWKVENTNFIVTFYELELYKVVTYDGTGNTLSTKTYFYETNLPENIGKAVRAKYPEGIMTEITQTDENNETRFDVYVMGDVEFWHLQLDKSGKIIKTEIIPD